jgi:choline dehydrogenase-like flavoprotein
MPNIQPRKDTADVVVIGSGAGGGVIAKELGEAGLQVVVLEAGSRYTPAKDYQTDRPDFELRATRVFEPENPRRDAYTVGAGPFNLNRAKGIGGSTLHYLAISPRFHESDFCTRDEDGVGENWPISYKQFEQYYTRVEYAVGMSGPGPECANPFDPPRTRPFPTPAHPFNSAGMVMKRGARKLGLHFVREPLAIPTTEWNGRRACISAGTCNVGCGIAAKSSVDVVWVPKAEATGCVEFRPNSMAREITVRPDGKARGVIYFDSAGRETEIVARAVVVAGNAVETPRLLLMSRSKLFPDGLANSSGLVGKYFTEHLAVFAGAVFDDHVRPWQGVPSSGMIQDYYATSNRNSFARGWTILVSNGSHWPLAVSRRTPGWGAVHKQRTKTLFQHSVKIVSVGEQLPDIRNEVTLDPIVKDCWGLPAPRLTSALSENDKAMIMAIKRSLAELLEAAGATEIYENTFVPGGSAHYLGTCRMGSDPRTSVVDAWCRSHDVPNLFIGDGSPFVTGAAVNPALTISALALRTAEGIVTAFRRSEL